MQISKVKARQIIDSRGNPTIEVDVWIGSEFMGRASVPSGASTGSHEALELRDGDNTKFMGNSVYKAISNVEGQIANTLVGRQNLTQEELDKTLITLDATESKSNLGANAILGVSIAYAKACANFKKIPLYKYISDIYGGSSLSIPRPMFNLINGGRHANWATDIQEFMIMVQSEDYNKQLQTAVEVFHSLESILKSKGLNTNVGNEGGFAPGFKNNEEAFVILSEAITKSGYELGKDIVFAIDIASSEFYDTGKQKYILKTENRELEKEEWSAMIGSWINKYPIKSIEDPFAEDDWEKWSELTRDFGNSIQIVGDDLLVTNKKRILEASEKQACNALLVKLNQIGTLTETLEAMKLGKSNGWNNIVSHRSGETEDTTIAHLAVGTNASQIKTGAPSRGERTCKYNELTRIAEELY